MMAMGDSITAAFAEGCCGESGAYGADFSNIFDGIKEYRGHSWSIGFPGNSLC